MLEPDIVASGCFVMLYLKLSHPDNCCEDACNLADRSLYVLQMHSNVGLQQWCLIFIRTLAHHLSSLRSCTPALQN